MVFFIPVSWEPIDIGFTVNFLEVRTINFKFYNLWKVYSFSPLVKKPEGYGINGCDYKTLLFFYNIPFLVSITIDFIFIEQCKDLIHL